MGGVSDAAKKLVKSMELQKNTELSEMRIVYLDPNDISHLLILTESDILPDLKYRKVTRWESLFSRREDVIYRPDEGANLIWTKSCRRFNWLKESEWIFWIEENDKLHCVVADVRTGEVRRQPYVKIYFKDYRREPITLYVNPDDTVIFDKIWEMKNENKPIWINYEL